MAPLSRRIGSDPGQSQVLPPETHGFINLLRLTAMACRVKPRAHLFEACALLQGNPDASREAHAEALMRCLSEALGTRARLHAPGETDLTFDERWLLQLGLACAQGDEASVSFLLASRVRHEHRRLVRFLIGQIADCFTTV